MRIHQGKQAVLSQAQPQARRRSIHSDMVGTSDQLAAIWELKELLFLHLYFYLSD